MEMEHVVRSIILITCLPGACRRSERSTRNVAGVVLGGVVALLLWH